MKTKNIDDETYDKLMAHTNAFLKKLGYEKFDGKLYTYIVFGPYRRHRVEVVPPRQIKTVLDGLYKNILTTKNGRDSFFAKVREHYSNISREEVFNYLKKQENYQLHLVQPREKLVKPLNIKKINQRWQIDLILMKGYSGPLNKNMKYILTVIDVFSKYAWAAAMPNNKGFTTRKYLEEILNLNHSMTYNYPTTIQSDNGVEFVNKDFDYLFKVFEIKHIRSPPYLPQMNACIERFNKTLKQAIFANMTKNNNKKWVDDLPAILENYNNSIHTTLKDKPINIHKFKKQSIKQQKLVDKKIENFISTTRSYAPLEKNDKVRIHILTNKEERKEAVFAKKYVPQWSREIYTIKYITGEQSAKVKPTYQLRDENNKIVNKTFYRHDLQKI